MSQASIKHTLDEIATASDALAKRILQAVAVRDPNMRKILFEWIGELSMFGAKGSGCNHPICSALIADRVSQKIARALEMIDVTNVIEALSHTDHVDELPERNTDTTPCDRKVH